MTGALAKVEAVASAQSYGVNPSLKKIIYIYFISKIYSPTKYILIYWKLVTQFSK